MKSLSGLLSTGLLLVAAAACAAPAALSEREARLRCGTVAHVKAVQVERGEQWGLGSAMGTAHGGLMGVQVGTSTRRDVASVMSAMGWDERAAATSQASMDDAQARPGQAIIVRLDNGVGVSVVQEPGLTLRVGDRVRIEGSGAKARVVPRT